MSTPLPWPAIHATHGGIWIATPDGAVRSVGRGEAIALAAETPAVLLNAPVTATRLGYGELSGLDLLELFAFVHPARFVVPTPAGMARALGLEPPADDAAAAPFLLRAAAALLDRLGDAGWAEREGGWTAAQAMFRLRWPWAAAAVERIDRPERAERWLFSKLPEWEEAAPRPQPRPLVLADAETDDALARLVGSGAEPREGQRLYAEAAARVFDPRRAEGRPNMLLAEAGTGIGKTLGYLAPASLWAAEAGGTVWVSTYTKALQRQLDRETARIFPHPADRARRVVVRKGRENYLCLLNLEDALQGGFQGRAAILAQLVARWAAYSRDGDMVGGDLPGWLVTLFRRAGSTALTDRRGECVYAGCPHYRKCFIERSARAAEGADLVIANHALVMILATRRREEGLPLARMVFDEGHHLFDAADSTFATALTGQETIELRRWIVGPEGKSRGRRRGLSARLSDVASYDEEGALAIDAAVEAASALPADGWLGRLGEGLPLGPVERLLAAVRDTVYARASAADAGYGLETEAAELDPALIDAAAPAARALEALVRPLARLRQRLEGLLEDGPDWLDGPARARIEGAVAGLSNRGQLLAAWVALLARIGGPVDPDYVDWLAVDRIEGREFDIGLHRHWLDPTRPLAETVLKPAHGVLVTSATLRGGEDWAAAEARTGAVHLDQAVPRFEAPSPFDYAARAEVLIVTDLKRGDLAGLGLAYARLIQAAGGGTLGLFTAIQRLKAVHARIADRLAREGLPLYAQHVDPIDTGTLVDIFRDDRRASLLGTDALRDGVDVPGESLRLVVMEGVPWPRPTVLHAARRAAGGGSAHDDRVVRARLAQAFGRLIRRADDRGAFVLLSAATPSRLLDAFPAGVPVRRLTLDEAVAHVAALNASAPANPVGAFSPQQVSGISMEPEGDVGTE
ncbi:ATP-dependent DNA helicase [Edaphosphingomonas haloaromaticamans]|uniref:Putative ATP-dependent helicase DinG n=1 Tax=Edaphosphingomonas haloaromaticamans TaxID=653954 RepID=A0A1S1HIG2_9SPHN|nr:ATP-dependent DNA helicase [Sphingomonas haloaromaticamans]OHT22064.1 putative ATP-dependent helicase DinG [Sphingomonas haloaromaticamans]